MRASSHETITLKKQLITAIKRIIESVSAAAAAAAVVRFLQQ